jgi:hypothetical protein
MPDGFIERPTALITGAGSGDRTGGGAPARHGRVALRPRRAAGGPTPRDGGDARGALVGGGVRP